MIKKVTFVLLIACFLLLFASCIEIGGYDDDLVSENEFIDNMGNRFIVEKPFTRIVSMDCVHTYNLFHIGAGDLIVGVDEKSVFPIEAIKKQIYSLDIENDISRIIDAKPDAVLITPTINRDNTEFVTALEVNDINVISMMPNDFSEFSSYITKLGIICGKNTQSKKALDDFYKELSDIESKTRGIENKTKVFFESDEKFYATPCKGSLPYIMMQVAGVDNIAGARRPMVYGDVDAKFGLDRILRNKDEIEVYLSLKGSGSSLISISQKSEFRNLNAVKGGRAYEMPKELINQYSFRLVDGANEIARLCYPEYMDSIKEYKNDEFLTRESFSQIVYNMLHMQTFINSNTEYYEHKRYGHTYGAFLDVDFTHDDFDIIETICMHSYLDIDDEFFDRQKNVTKYDLAMFLNIAFELDDIKNDDDIVDILELKNKRVIEKVVANGLMDSEMNAFEPEKVYTNNEFISLMIKALESSGFLKMIKAVDLKKEYGEKLAVDGVSFEIEKGVSLGLLGPNGAGKTTTIKMLLGLLNPTSGEVFIDDKRMSRQQNELKKDIGLVSQHISLQRDMTPRETLNLHGMLHNISKKERVSRIDELLKFADLYEDKDALISTLSGGNKRKLMIIRSVMHKPKVLFLDEPTVGLDAKIRRSIWDLLKKLKHDGMSILLTTHYIEEAKTLCDEIAMIKKGRIVAKDSPQGFLDKEKSYVVEVFDGINTEYYFFEDRHLAAGFAESKDFTATIRRTNLEDVYIKLTDTKLAGLR